MKWGEDMRMHFVPQCRLHTDCRLQIIEISTGGKSQQFLFIKNFCQRNPETDDAEAAQRQDWNRMSSEQDGDAIFRFSLPSWSCVICRIKIWITRRTSFPSFARSIQLNGDETVIEVEIASYSSQRWSRTRYQFESHSLGPPTLRSHCAHPQLFIRIVGSSSTGNSCTNYYYVHHPQLSLN